MNSILKANGMQRNMSSFRKAYQMLVLVLCLKPVTGIAAQMDLEYAIAMALKNNPAVSGKMAEVEAKHYAKDAAMAQRYPSLSVQAGVQKSDAPSNTEQDQEILMLRVQQPLWAFGRIDDNIDFAQQDLSADQADLVRIKQDLTDKTVSAYVQVLSNQAQLKVAEDYVDSHQTLYQRIQRRQKGQLASSADVGLASIRLIQAKALQQQLQGEHRLLLNELASIVVMHVDGVARVDTQTLTLPSLGRAEDDLLYISADVRFKKQLIEVAKAKAEQASSSAFPTVYFQADKYLNQLGFSNGTQYSVMLQGDLQNMGFSSMGEVKAANARITAEKQNLAVTEQELLRKLRNYYQQRQLQGQLIKMYAGAVAEVKEIIESYIRQYDADRKSWIEVLNMQKEVIDQRMAKVKAEHEWLLNTLRIKVLLGQLSPKATSYNKPLDNESLDLE